MKQIPSHEILGFTRRYRFAGARLLSFRIHATKRGVLIDTFLRAQPSQSSLAPVKLKIRCVAVEEYRFQKRSNTNPARVSDVRLGYFDGLIFINFDAWGLQPGDVPAVYDYRASDAYMAGKELWCEEVPTLPKPQQP